MTNVCVFGIAEDAYWYSTNCGHDKGFVCKKAPGSDQPVTVPPTAQVPGFCPKGFFGIGKAAFCNCVSKL